MPTRRLFIADDEADFRTLVRRVADEFGWQTTECANGKELLAALEISPGAALVLLDMMMPEMDGIEVLYKLPLQSNDIRVRLVTGGPSVYAYTARMLVENESRLEEDILIKPVSIDQLRAVLAA